MGSCVSHDTVAPEVAPSRKVQRAVSPEPLAQKSVNAFIPKSPESPIAPAVSSAIDVAPLEISSGATDVTRDMNNTTFATKQPTIEPPVQLQSADKENATQLPNASKDDIRPSDASTNEEIDDNRVAASENTVTSPNQIKELSVPGDASKDSSLDITLPHSDFPRLFPVIDESSYQKKMDDMYEQAKKREEEVQRKLKEIPILTVDEIRGVKPEQHDPIPQVDSPPLAENHPLGLSIEFFNWFVKTHKLDEYPYNTLTTSQVCAKIIVPELSSLNCTYISLLGSRKDEETGQPFLGPANMFVSHAWSFRFETCLDTLRQHDEANKKASNEKTYFWFDLFANNQISAASLPQSWWSTTFKSHIASIGSVLLILHPWDKPIPLTRAWCLWEIMCALTTPGVNFLGGLPSTDTRRIVMDVTRNGDFTGLADPHVDSSKSQAFKKDDQDMIHNAISSNIGFETVDKTVGECIRVAQLRGLVGAAALVLKDGRGPFMDTPGRTLNRIGLCLISLDGNKEAAEVFEMCVKWDLEQDPLGEDAANSYLNLGDCWLRLKMFEKALENYQAAIRIFEALSKKLEDEGHVGPSYLETQLLSAKRDMGRCYFSMKDYASCVEVCTSVLKRLSEIYDTPPDDANDKNADATVVPLSSHDLQDGVYAKARVQFLLAQGLWQLGRREEALECVKIVQTVTGWRRAVQSLAAQAAIIAKEWECLIKEGVAETEKDGKA
ncbi:Kinesin light chain 3 [Chytridiales sp. JEL 0842]|nr:Kinesin light chain 3 [Chytridiales sp. JEL 0842]